MNTTSETTPSNYTYRTVTTTTRRAYFLEERAGMFFASFQPINPKTGKRWQAVRRIVKGRDCYRLANGWTKFQTAVIPGPLPPFEVWTQMDGGMTGAEEGFSTETLALAAIAEARAKEGGAKVPMPSRRQQLTEARAELQARVEAAEREAGWDASA